MYQDVRSSIQLWLRGWLQEQSAQLPDRNCTNPFIMSIVRRRGYDKLQLDGNIDQGVALRCATFLSFASLTSFDVFGFSTVIRAGLPVRLYQESYSVLDHCNAE